MRFLCILCVLFFVTQPVAAYERVSRALNYAVEQKHADAISPIGLSFASFDFFPVFGVGEEYSDNILKTEVLALDDFITHVAPGFKLQSNWNRHQLALKVNSDLAFYAKYSGQDYRDVTVDFSGRLDVLKNSAFSLGTFFGALHEERQSVDQQGAIEPTSYRLLDMDMAYKHQFNRFSVLGKFDVSRRDYNNVELITGAIRDNKDRNRWDYLPSVRLSYEIQPQFDAFINLRYTKIDYDQINDRNGLERSSQGGDAVFGFAFDATGLITGDLALGYKYRAYDDFDLEDISGMTGWLSVEWRVTPLSTLYSKVTQDIGETTQRGVSGSDNTSVTLGVEHELLRSLILKLDGGYTFMQYKGFDSTIFNDERTEHRYFASLGGKYTFSRYLYMDLTYRFSARQSNRLLNDYDQNRVFLNFVARM